MESRLSQEPDAVRMRAYRLRKKLARAEKKRKSANAKKGHQTKLLNQLLSTHKDFLTTQKTSARSHLVVAQAVAEHPNQVPNSLLSSSQEHASIPSSVSILTDTTTIATSSVSTLTDAATAATTTTTVSPLGSDSSAPAPRSQYASAAVASLTNKGADTSTKRKRVDDEEPFSNASVATNLELPIPKKARPQTTSPRLKKPDLSVLFQSNTALEGIEIHHFDLSRVVLSSHAQYRLRVRAGIVDPGPARQLMAKGVLVPNRRHHGWMVWYREQRAERSVNHFWRMEFCKNEVIVKTYFAKSPFTHPGYFHRRDFLLQSLTWLSTILGVPLQLTGGYLARVIGGTGAFQTLSVPGLPAVMDLLANILPTPAEFQVLRDIPFSSEMGEPESWIMSIGGQLGYAREKVDLMRRLAWMEEEEQQQ